MSFLPLEHSFYMTFRCSKVTSNSKTKYAILYKVTLGNTTTFVANIINALKRVNSTTTVENFVGTFNLVFDKVRWCCCTVYDINITKS